MIKNKLFGKQNPYVWAAEWVYGCNYKCGHCAIPALGLHNKFKFMSMDTWCEFCEVIQAAGPQSRIEMAMMGEPTLHPDIYKLLKIGRMIVPDGQFHITTNGSTLLSGKVTYEDLFASGANIIYTDMYGDPAMFEALAKESGVHSYFYYPEKHIGRTYTAEEEKLNLSPWNYQGADMRLIVLQDHPANWPASRNKANLLGTWLNHIDEEAAAKFGMKMVTEAPFRRCNQPFINCVINYKGDYLLCCQDAAEETEAKIGNVRDGIEGFKRTWLNGQFMQAHRRWLREKDRMSSPHCAKCSITFSRSDFRHWTDEQVSFYIDNDGKRTDFVPSLYRVEGQEPEKVLL